MDYLGEIAALLTSVFFTLTAIIFTQASRQVGSLITNRVRLVIALIYLMLINLVLYGQSLPLGAGPEHWFWLSLSGIIGLALGDMFLFSAFQTIGARLGMLLLSLAPIIGALLAWAVFGETLLPGQIIGIGLTLIGIMWVVMTRPADHAVRPGAARRGVLYGILAATGQAVGLVLSKQGMSEGFSPFAGNAIRMLAAMVVFWLITFAQRQGRETIQTVRQQLWAYQPRCWLCSTPKSGLPAR